MNKDKNYISLLQAAALAPSRPSISAIWRWARKGVKTRSGRIVKLAHIRSGRAIFTTKEDLERFFHELAEGDASHFDAQREPAPLVPKTRSKAEAKRAHEAAEEKLRKHGVL